jgi:hypothetical protein
MATKTMGRGKDGEQVGRGPCSALTMLNDQTFKGQFGSKIVESEGNEGNQVEDVNAIY